jgi:cytochrome c-type biogenesis protein CcmH
MMKKLVLILTAVNLIHAVDNQETLILDIKKSLIAPCCWSGTVYDHGHQQMEDEIEAFVKEGRSKEEILDHYVAQYGERILASPIAKGFNLFAWIVPALILGVGLFIIIMYIRSPREEPKKGSVKTTKTPYDDQIEKELESFDQ